MKTTAKTLAAIAAFLFAGLPVQAQIYKIVDENGNVTYTDQAPGDGADPMRLPELQVVETEPAQPLTDPNAAAAGSEDPTPRELRRLYRDFKITRPQPDETFWGTSNQVVVSWGSATELGPDMSVRVYLNGAPQETTRMSMLALTLDRGEYTVHADLLDGEGRRIVSTSPVTFFIKQNSALFNPGGGAAAGGR